MLTLPSVAHSFGKFDSRNGDECRAQVNANYDALVAEMQAHGNLQGVEVVNRKKRYPDLKECDQMDQRAQEMLMSKAHQRLSSALETIRARGLISADVRRVLSADHEAILKFPPAPYREAYLRLYADYQRYESLQPAQESIVVGKAQVYRCTGTSGQIEFSQRPCATSDTQAELAVKPLCKEYEARVESAKKKHDDAVTALLPGKPGDGMARAVSGWESLEERRLTALSEWQWQRDRARAAGCTGPYTEELILRQAAVPADSSSAEPLDDAPMASGRLRSGGDYVGGHPDGTVTMLPDGAVWIYGNRVWLDGRIGQEAQTHFLRHRHNSDITARRSNADPMLWDPAKRGWRKLPSAPECQSSARYLHTATAISGGKVLIAGGLCDMPKMGDDHEPHKAYAALSLWDSATRQWLPAPSLHQPRIHHSASLMPDGSVLLVGGESDPGLSPVRGEPVLASAEQYTAGKVTPLPPLMAARAKHTATVLADGSVLVAGGFDATGRPIAEVELWIPGTSSWRRLPALQLARHSHTATRLADGRVLIAGGVGLDGRPLSSSEIWDPDRQLWSAGANLPIPLHGHAAALLTSGQVLVAGGAWISSYSRPIPWAWTWDALSGEWLVAGHTMPSNEIDLSSGITLAPRPDGSAMVFTSLHILFWEPFTQAPANTAPLWRMQPTAAQLSDGRVMLVGHEDNVTGWKRRTAHIWNPANDSWTTAGSFGDRSSVYGNIIQLPSGRVIHVDINEGRTLTCEMWEPVGNGWQGCGSAPLEYASRWRIELGLLPNGRAFAIANMHEVLVFDEVKSAWTRWPVEWSTEGMIYGAPIRGKQPLARIRDEINGQWVEINAVAARFWLARGGARSTRLLWDGKAGWWAYVLSDYTMGQNAQLLPDGCAISTNPLAMFNPNSGKVKPLIDPGIGIDLKGIEMVVLRDGTVVMAGVSPGAKDPGAGFFHGKASCAGLERHVSDDAYLAGGTAKDEPVITPTAKKTAEEQAQPHQLHWQDQALQVLNERRWLLLASLGPILAYLVLRRTRIRRMQIGPSWTLRLLVYGLFLIFVVPAIWSYLRFDHVMTARTCEEDPKACLDPDTGILRSRKSVQGGESGESYIPCRMVGVWSSRQDSIMYRIELKDDGSYVMEPNQKGSGNQRGYTGRWAVQGQNMVWRHDQYVGDLDVNPILPESDTRFTLIEGNGRRTNYELIRAISSERCRR